MYTIGSVFSLLSAKDRERLQRASDSAKQVTAGQTEGHAIDEGRSVAPDGMSKSSEISSDGG